VRRVGLAAQRADEDVLRPGAGANRPSAAPRQAVERCGGQTPPFQAPPPAWSSPPRSTARAPASDSPPVQSRFQDSGRPCHLRDTLVTCRSAPPSGRLTAGTEEQVRSVNGVATFAELRLARRQRLHAHRRRSGPATRHERASASCRRAATQLAFTVHPSVAMAGQRDQPRPSKSPPMTPSGQATNFTGPIRVGDRNGRSVLQTRRSRRADPVTRSRRSNVP